MIQGRAGAAVEGTGSGAAARVPVRDKRSGNVGGGRVLRAYVTDDALPPARCATHVHGYRSLADNLRLRLLERLLARRASHLSDRPVSRQRVPERDRRPAVRTRPHVGPDDVFGCRRSRAPRTRHGVERFDLRPRPSEQTFRGGARAAGEHGIV